jgi:hypothetical protein
MVAHFWSGHAQGWELAVWWVGIAAPLTVAMWAWWPSRRRRLARTAAETARVLREIANAALLDDSQDRNDDRNTEVDA